MKTSSSLLRVSRLLVTTVAAIGMGMFGIYLFTPIVNNIDPATTATIAGSDLRGTRFNDDILKSPPPLIDAELQLLKSALTAVDEGDFIKALDVQSQMKARSVDQQLISWLIATSGDRSVPASQIRAAQQELKKWPSQTTMSQNLERAMARDPLSIVRLRLGLGDKVPETFQAAFAIAKSHQVLGNRQAIRKLIVHYWHDKALSANDEKRIIESFETELTQRDHEIRFFNMMARDRVKSGQRIASLIGYEALHTAWTAVIRRQKRANDLIDGLGENDQKTAAYFRMKVENLRRNDKDDEAIALLKAMPSDPEFLISPDAWWDERRIISRHKFENGDAQTAYDLVSSIQPSGDKIKVDAAFHAGWYALIGLEKPALAAPHFQKITNVAKGNISQARGYYWLGRSLTDKTEARKAFEEAAKRSTTFYGQLAAEKLGLSIGIMGKPLSPQLTGATMPAPLKAVERLLQVGHKNRARKLHIALGWSMNDPQYLRWAADVATDHGDHYAALKIAKAADWRGIDVGLMTHPTGAISDGTDLSRNDIALAYAVARQESEFNISAVSGANAKGLLQLLPGTAKEMARLQNIAYQPTKLTTDGNYNARLGAAYLNQQLAKFGGSYVLTFAAYNAGPRRAQEWVKRFGDPRGKSIEEIVDWIEKIPFPETRSYVQRILENLQIYKTQLGQDTSIVKDLQFGAFKSN